MGRVVAQSTRGKNLPSHKTLQYPSTLPLYSPIPLHIQSLICIGISSCPPSHNYSYFQSHHSIFPLCLPFHLLPKACSPFRTQFKSHLLSEAFFPHSLVLINVPQPKSPVAQSCFFPSLTFKAALNRPLTLVD